MSLLVVALGVLVTVAALVLMARPQQLRPLLLQVFDTNWLYAAALARLLFGAGLIAVADGLRFPLAISIIGWLAVLGGLGLVVIPRPALLRLSEWFADMRPGMTRAWLSLALLFGLFLIYAGLG